MVPEQLIMRWEAAYRRYHDAARLAASTPPDAADLMASASAEVASAWHALQESAPGLPWWTRAALTTAAQAFRHQSEDWTHVARRPEPPTAPTQLLPTATDPETAPLHTAAS